MGKRGTLLSLALGLCLGSALAVPTDQPTPANANAERIGKLIEQLGNGRFAVREAATKELDAIGEPALAALKKAAESTDMEVARRAAALVEKIGKRCENARLIAPTVVELSFKDKPVPEAVAELSKKSGYQVVLGGDVTKLKDRKVTLETGKVPFWTALDLLCKAADLTEANGFNGPVPIPLPGGPPTGPRGGPVPVPVPLPAVPAQPIRVRPVKPVPALPAKPIPIKPIQIEKVPPQQFNFGFAVEGAEAPKAPPAPPPPAQPVQVQVQQVQPVQIQIQIGGAPGPAFNPVMPIRGGGPMLPGPGHAIVLVDQKYHPLPTHVEGAVRVRALPAANAARYGPPRADEIPVVLEARPEPKLAWQNVVGVKVDKATDDQGQSLSAAMLADNGGGVQPGVQVFPGRGGIAIARPLPVQPAFVGGTGNEVVVRLKKGDKESKALKELSGVLTVNVRTAPEAIVAVENVMKAKATAVKAPKADAALRVMEVKKTDAGDYQVRVEVSYSNEVQPAMPGQLGPVNGPFGGPLPPQFNGRIQIQVAPAVPNAPPAAPNAAPQPVVWNPLGLELTDGKDKAFQLANFQFQQQQFNGRGMTSVATLTFRPADKEQGEPAKLTFKGTRLVTVDIPFALKDVPLK